MTAIDNSAILKNLCKKVQLSLPSPSSSDNSCTICTLPMNPATLNTLKCNHKFHYDCIFGWYKTCADKFMSNGNNFKCQTCPYCRNKGGWLPVKEGSVPIEYINHDHVKVVYSHPKKLTPQI